MSLATFYHHKVKQCAKLAAEASTPQEHTRYKEEGALWRELAKDLAKQDRAEREPP